MKYILTFLIICAITSTAISQTFKGQSEFSASYGINSFQQSLQGGIGGGSEVTEITSATPNLFLTYRYYLSNRFAIGITIGTQQFTTASYDPYYTGVSNLPYKTDAYNYTTVTAEFLYNYLNRHWVRLYTYIGVGCSFYKKNIWEYSGPNNAPWTNTSGNQAAFNMQYVPIAISVGGRLSGFAELGIGYKGFLNAGISYRLPYHAPKSILKQKHNDDPVLVKY